MKLRNKGMTAIDLVYFAVVVIVGVSIFQSFDSTTQTLTSSSTVARLAAGNVSANTYSGFQTISSGPVIIAAVVILGIVGMLMMRK
jgi:predicted ABC-type sugar transport system permease subunit